VGCLSTASRESQLHLIKAFEEGLRSLGYRVGENVVIEYRFADGAQERVSALAADLVRLGVDVIACSNGLNAVAALKATTTIPIVTVIIDPIAMGLVASIARPGGNITGVTIAGGLELIGKRIGLLVEAMPKLSTVGYLVSRPYWEDPRGAATREAAGI